MTTKQQVLHNIFGFDVNDANYLVNISNKHQYIYFENPKVGCSTIKKTLQKLEVEESLMPEDVHDKHLSPLLSPLQLEKVFTEYLNDEYFKFSFVRNPYTRILSCYLDKILGSQKETILPQLGFKPADKVSFEEFLTAVKKQSYDEMNVHWKPQNILLAAKNITLDFVGRQENFDNDLKKVLAIITKQDSEGLRITNEIPHSVGANEKLRQYLNEEIISLIREIYHDDFKLYGYNEDPFSDQSIPIDRNANSNEQNLVSIVIPCYNQAEYLNDLCQSIDHQTYKNIEIIIVNDGSSDNTEEVSKNIVFAYPQYNIKLINQKNRGLSEARNTGVHYANGEYIVTVDADDKLHPSMIETAINTLKENNVDIIYGDYQRFGEETTIQKTKKYVDLYFIQYKNITGATALYRKDVWKKTGGYKQNMHGGYEDWEFWVNAAKLGFKFFHVPQIFFYYRVKKESMYTDSLNKHNYLCSKIVLNHPELYTDIEIIDAIKSVKSYESAADIYFYLDIDIIPNEKVMIKALGQYVDKLDLYDTLFTQPYYTVGSLEEYGNVTLYNINYINTFKELSSVIKHKNSNLVIFYSSLRYNEVNGLKRSAYAWQSGKGCIKAHGSIFPINIEKEPEKLLAAYKHSQQYYKEYSLKLEKIYNKQKNRYMSDFTINTLRDSAIVLEKENIKLAYELMSIAHQARPDGPFIKKKLDEYKSLIQDNE